MDLDLYLLSLRDSFKDGDSDRFNATIQKRYEEVEKEIDGLLKPDQEEIVEPVASG